MVKRYDKYGNNYPSGLFVLYDEHQFTEEENKALKAENTALKSELDALREQVRWRDFKIEKPDAVDGNKIIAFGAGYIFEAEFDDGFWCSIGGEQIDLWMPLPTAQTSQSNKD